MTLLICICENPNCPKPNRQFDLTNQQYRKKYCTTPCMRIHTKEQKLQDASEKQEIAQQKKLDMQAVRIENKNKKQALFKHFASCITDYKKNSLAENQLKDWITHIKQKPEYIDMCNKKIAECGGKISMLSFTAFVSSNCSEAKLRGLDNDKKF